MLCSKKLNKPTRPDRQHSNEPVQVYVQHCLEMTKLLILVMHHLVYIFYPTTAIQSQSGVLTACAHHDTYPRY